MSSQWNKKTNIDKEERRENDTKHDTAIDNGQQINVSAKRLNASFESSGTKVEETNLKQALAHIDDKEYKHYRGRLIYRNNPNDTIWYYVD